MRYLIHIVSLMVCMFLSNNIIAQELRTSDKILPRWVSNPPIAHNPALLNYIPVTIYTDNLQSATALALNQLADHLPREWNVTSVVETNEQGLIKRDRDGISDSEHMQTFSLDVISEGKPVEIRCQLVDDYWEQVQINGSTRYKNIQLYQVAAPGTNAPFENVTRTTSYGVEGLWRSAVLPGWGQFYKGDKLKGGLMLGGTAALAVGIVFTEIQRAEYMRLIKKTHNADTKQIYATRSTNWAIGRNVCIGTLSALYVYNLIDALVAPGAKRIIRLNDGRRNYAIAPTVMPNGSAGLYAAITF